MIQENQSSVPNQWDQVDDFKWLKAAHSPNWSVLPLDDRLDDEAWKELGKSMSEMSVDQILRTTHVIRS